MGARALAEFALDHPEMLANEAVGTRYYDTWKEVIKLPSLKALVPAAAAHMRLLHAVDVFPRGVRVWHLQLFCCSSLCAIIIGYMQPTGQLLACNDGAKTHPLHALLTLRRHSTQHAEARIPLAC